MNVLITAKQVPRADSLLLGPSGRMLRDGVPLEMNAYCRRAVAKGVEVARSTGGCCTVVSLGPPEAEDILREALAWGADEAILLSDPVFAGSDTLATARALAALARQEGPFDLILVGRSSLDSETGQVGPELAELLDLPFASAVRELHLSETGDTARVRCEQDDGWRVATVRLPAVLAVAERLCPPAKMPPEAWEAIPSSRVRRLRAGDLSDRGPWGAAASPTRVGTVRMLESHRLARCCVGPVERQVDTAVCLLEASGALDEEPRESLPAMDGPGLHRPDGPLVGVLLEPGRPDFARELLGCAVSLASGLDGRVVAVGPEPADAREVWRWGADELVEIGGIETEEDFAAAAVPWASEHGLAVMLAPASYWGREVASRLAAALGAGLTGDALELEVTDGRLVAWKPACGGTRLAAITATSPLQMATVRPGVLPLPGIRSGEGEAVVTRLDGRVRGRVRIESSWKDDDFETLSRAPVVIGVGAGVDPDSYPEVRRLAAVLGAELAGTRKVTDRGWLPRSRQIGITGRTIAPRLYVAIGIKGKLNHMVGVRDAGTVLAVNSDREAPVFLHCDVGIVGDWREVVRLLAAELQRRGAGSSVDAGVDPAVPSELSIP